MSLQTPTISDLRDNIVAQLEAALSQTVPLLPVGFTRVLAAAIAGAIIIVYKFCGFMLLQQYARYASYDEITVGGKTFSPLRRLGDRDGVDPPVDATRAVHTIELTVVAQTGSLPAGTVFTFPATGWTYVTQASVALDAATKLGSIIAIAGPGTTLGEGALGNVPVGGKLSMVVSDARVLRDAKVTGVTTTAINKEPEASYRKRVMDRRRVPPKGGSYSHYRDWALEVPGIVAAYPYKAGPGLIDVYVEASVGSSGSPLGIPTAPQLAAVRDYLRDPARRPANDGVTAKSIARHTVDAFVFGLAVEDEATVTARIQSALDQHFRSLEPFIDGLSAQERAEHFAALELLPPGSPPPQLLAALSSYPHADLVTLPTVSAVVLDVVAAAGGYYSAIEIDGDEDFNYYQLGTGQKAMLGTLTIVPPAP